MQTKKAALPLSTSQTKFNFLEDEKDLVPGLFRLSKNLFFVIARRALARRGNPET